MRGLKIGRTIAWLLAAGPIMLPTALLLSAQYDQNSSVPKIDVSGYPPEIQRGYGVFKEKCSQCHSLGSSLKLSMSPEQWNYWVGQMEALPSSHLNDGEAKEILDFLKYDEVHRKAAAKATASGAPGASQNTVALGRQFYIDQNCDLCHTLGGKGGTIGPSLDNVGNRQTREQLVKRMQGRRAGTVMPPLPSETTDQQIDDLVDFLLTLKGKE